MSIYESYYDTMIQVMEHIAHQLEANSRRYETEHGDKLYEHLNYRIKGDESMRDKLVKRGLAPTAYNALRKVKDSIGLRVVCLFIDDVYENVALLKSLPGCSVVQEKDYIKDAKPNGYRSYHMILDVMTDAPDVDGKSPGHYYVEIQLRTIAMDTWAALEHELKYKKNIANPELITQELHRCANELASCDVSMQTLRKIIRSL
jgi:ppGpp synthetase/RelA/SpoT-type nucleotidyltranferase